MQIENRPSALTDSSANSELVAGNEGLDLSSPRATGQTLLSAAGTQAVKPALGDDASTYSSVRRPDSQPTNDGTAVNAKIHNEQDKAKGTNVPFGPYSVSASKDDLAAAGLQERILDTLHDEFPTIPRLAEVKLKKVEGETVACHYVIRAISRRAR